MHLQQSTEKGVVSDLYLCDFKRDIQRVFFLVDSIFIYLDNFMGSGYAASAEYAKEA